MAESRAEASSTAFHGLFARALAAPIIAYRYLISPLMPPACRFHPSCSAYALEALATHGPVKGSWLALRRLARCHPFTLLGGGSGPDPVPRPPDRRSEP